MPREAGKGKTVKIKLNNIETAEVCLEKSSQTFLFVRGD